MVRIQVMVSSCPPHPTRWPPQLPIVGKCCALNLILSRRALRNQRPVLVALLGVATECRRARMPQDTLTITDNRTGKNYILPTANPTIPALDPPQLKTSP